MFLGVDAIDRKQAEEVLDTVCRVARRQALSESSDLVFGDRVYPVNPNSFPYPVESRVWHFTRGEYTEGDARTTWRVPPIPRKHQLDIGDPLGPPEPLTDVPQPQEADPALLQAPLPLAVKMNGKGHGGYQRLLLWLSAAGQGSQETFVHVSNELGLASDAFESRRVMRRLVLLGHVERDSQGRKWSAAPAALVQLATDPTRAFWCGQRCEPLRHRLTQLWPLTEPEPQPGNDGPPRWLVNIGRVREPGAVLKARGFCLRWEGVAAENLTQRLPALDDWRATLCDVPLTPPDRVKRWNTDGYHDETAFRVVHGRAQGPCGLYRLLYGDDKTSFELTGFLSNDGKFLRGDWYGLRFLAARNSGLSCPSRWLTHQGRSALLVPLSRRWPLLYERALVLASGLLPVHDGGRLCYFDVPRDIASTLAKLLGVTLL